jgi:hypothetical protein
VSGPIAVGAEAEGSGRKGVSLLLSKVSEEFPTEVKKCPIY